MVKKRLVVYIASGVLLIIVSAFSISFLLSSGFYEQKIAHYLYHDQTTQALRDVNLLLFFHPDNLYGIHIKTLLTLKNIRYP
jgi:hypothetical protein